MLAIPAI